MADYGRLLADRDDTCLCLRHDQAVDGPFDRALQALENAHARVLGPDTDLEVLVINEPIDRSQWHRLGQSVHGWLALPSCTQAARADFFAVMATPRLDGAAALRARMAEVADSRAHESSKTLDPRG
ncbi:MAG: hypothetical protein U1E76_10560 [Planctomycetota bacterium]